MSGEAPAEFALVDEFASQPQEPIAEQPSETLEPAIVVDQDEASPMAASG